MLEKLSNGGQPPATKRETDRRGVSVDCGSFKSGGAASSCVECPCSEEEGGSFSISIDGRVPAYEEAEPEACEGDINAEFGGKIIRSGIESEFEESYVLWGDVVKINRGREWGKGHTFGGDRG